MLTSTRHPRRTDFGAHRRLTFVLRPSGFEDIPLSPRKPIPQHGVAGTPPRNVTCLPCRNPWLAVAFAKAADEGRSRRSARRRINHRPSTSAFLIFYLLTPNGPLTSDCVLCLAPILYLFQPSPVPEPVHPQYDRHQKINPPAPLYLFYRQSKRKHQRDEPHAHRDAPTRQLGARHQSFPRIQSQRLT